jgi:hypothetical protein
VRIIKWLEVDFQGVATPPLASLREARRVHQPNGQPKKIMFPKGSENPKNLNNN